MFDRRQLAIIRYCAEEVARQLDGPIAVADMLQAWEYAAGWRNKAIDSVDILTLGRLVRPVTNMNGYRRIAVRVGPNIVKVHADDVPRCVDQLCAAVAEQRITAEDAYREFEEIHPFIDGNGRVGKILYNWIRGSLENPAMPPDFFGCANP